jgi:hypothetical protein
MMAFLMSEKQWVIGKSKHTEWLFDNGGSDGTIDAIGE